MGADLVGFHTYDYTSHFLRCLLRMLGYDNDMGKVFTEDASLRLILSLWVSISINSATQSPNVKFILK